MVIETRGENGGGRWERMHTALQYTSTARIAVLRTVMSQDICEGYSWRLLWRKSQYRGVEILERRQAILDHDNLQQKTY
jgi:hypothetical protein